MTKEKEKPKGNPDEAYELFTDLFTTFKESKIVISAPTNRHFAFDIMCGIAEFTSVVLKTLVRSSGAGDKIFDFYAKELLPSSYKLSEDLFEDIPPIMPVINTDTTVSN